MIAASALISLLSQNNLTLWFFELINTSLLNPDSKTSIAYDLSSSVSPSIVSNSSRHFLIEKSSSCFFFSSRASSVLAAVLLLNSTKLSIAAPVSLCSSERNESIAGRRRKKNSSSSSSSSNKSCLAWPSQEPISSEAKLLNLVIM
uniref:Uncharacterized protein n=1 Tax=Zea mays TaxID=4577 RepID=C0PAM4_MAIZE|nr:unknown [Zea mays]ACN31775.1 unknown [Zea mays]ACR37940.1 unknown [Zea mays]